MNNYDYSTAADYARLSGYHRTTIVQWIKQGKILAVNKTIKSKKKNRNRHWKIANKSIIKPICKEKPTSGRTWTETELYILANNIAAPLTVLAKLLDRSRNAIKVKRCRIKNI